MAMNPDIHAFYDPATGTVSYVLSDLTTRRAAVIDPVLDFDAKSGHTGTGSAEQILAHLAARGLGLDWILETHAHADHLSAAPYLRRQAGGRIAIGEKIVQVQASFQKLFNFPAGAVPQASDFDHLFADGERFMIGGIEATAMLVPGHTPADLAYAVPGAVFVGDTLFMPDVGSARADFPGGDARALYRSIQRLFALPPQTAVYVCHDYPPAGRAPQWQTTMAQQRAANIHVHDGIGEKAFIAMRRARDATLDAPALILPAIQVNLRAGQMPPPEANGIAYLRVPVNALPLHGAAPAAT